ncbi:MAG: transglycosylase domain-containing protein [Candidatus Sungbacteria bacterium]|uniref:Transglycosylase domain-containing protein n=1 Tax=Candidatus Sungiibacteriota bacterium TaxID=2750080 RepID=A0A932VRF7_9BACT|nr:transglycosylase domain-containing protein [Candidatus Sungbacteria bacterium]
MPKILVHKKNKSYKKRFFVLAGVIFIMGAGAWSAYSLTKDLPDPERITQRTVAQSTQIFDRTGTVLLYEVHGNERRTVIPFSDIPDRVRQATLAAEDLHFYSHGGIDWKGIARAILANITHRDFAQGGSTITQQLVKNSLLGSEKTIRRKIREQIVALLLERAYSKDEIFAMYLNQIPYGSNAYGIAAAAQMYFGKDVRNLSLAEAATIAALPKAPTHYSPYGSHKDELLQRKNWVLERMAGAGFISKDDALSAEREHLGFKPPRESMRAPHFVQYVREYLDKKYGGDAVEAGGLKVVTTLDWNMQQQAEVAAREGAARNKKLVKAYNAALVAIDPKTGDILAMAGSRDFSASPEPDGCTPGVNCKFDPYVNVALRPRQPGSAFKPFVYATAFKKGYTPETVLFDAPTEFNPSCNPDGSPGPDVRDPKTCYHPQDYDGQFRGPVSIRQALAQSLNVPSVALLYLAGIHDSIKTAQDLGITTLTEPDRYGLSLVLGGAEVTLTEITSAYGAFATDGTLHPASALLRVEDANGKVLEQKDVVSIAVLDPEVTRTLNDILSDNASRVPIFSPHSSLYFPDRQVAVKTGTTQDYHDAWTVGYTPSLVAGVWVGNNDNSPMNQDGLSVMVAGPIWHQFLASALASSTAETFTPPEQKSSQNPALRGIYQSGPIIKIDKISRKLATPYTPPDLIAELGSGAAASILSLVDKNNPDSGPPASPSADPQFKNWQAAVDQWSASHPLPFTSIPQESDAVHGPDKAPRIQLLSPAGDATPALREISASVTSTFPLHEVLFFLDDTLVDSRQAPLVSSAFTFVLDTAPAPGAHAIKITAYDAVGNKTSLEKNIAVVP